MKKLIVPLAVMLMSASPAMASGGFLHLREANALARKVQAEMGGHTSLSPCLRVDAHHADCKLIARSAQTYCTFEIRVTKRRIGRSVHWSAKSKATDCEYVG